MRLPRLRHCCVVVVVWLAAVAQAQQQPILTPLSYTAFLDPSNVSVRFTCTGEGFASWRVDGKALSESNRGVKTETVGEGEGSNFTSRILIPATVENNNIEVQCWASTSIVLRSETATFIIQGRVSMFCTISYCNTCRSPGFTPQPHYCGQ